MRLPSRKVVLVNLWRLADQTWQAYWHPQSGESDPGFLFVNVLKNSGVALAGIPIVTFEVDSYQESSAFLTPLQKELSTSPVSGWSIKSFDMPSKLGPDDFHEIDGHPNAAGHRKIADAVMQAAGQSAR